MPARSVVLLSGYSPSLVTFRGTLIRQLVARGYRVIGCGPEDDAVEQALRRLGAEFRSLGPLRASVNPFHDVAYMCSLVLFLIRLRSHAVIAYTVKPVIWGMIAAWVTRVPVRVAMITGLGFTFGEVSLRWAWARRIARGLYRVAMSCATLAIFQNPDDRDEFRRLGLLSAGEGAVVNGSGVELDRFEPVPTPGTGTFLMIARLLVDKGLREFVEAARLLHAKFPQARFRVAGWIDDNPASIDQAELDGWVRSGCIEFLGRLDDVRPAIADADVYVLPSYREGTPRTVLEAMAMGRPIVTTDVPGCRQTVVDGVNGFLVPVRDAAALAATMQRFLQAPSLVRVMGHESRRMAEDRYGAESVAKAVMDVACL